MTSILRKPPVSRKNFDTVTGAVLTNGGQIKIDLPMDFLTTEHVLNVRVSQTWGTNAPTAAGSDVRRAFSKFELTSSKGVLFSCDFYQLYDMARITEAASAPVFAYGAGGGAAATVDFKVDVHSIMDKCLYDLWTALNSADYASLAIVLTCSPDATSVFGGGTGTIGAAAYSVRADQRSLPGYSGKTEADRAAIGMGMATHKFMHLAEIIGGASVSSQKFKLTGEGRVRFLLLHCYSVTGGNVPANGIIDTVSLSFGGTDYLANVRAIDIQQDNVSDRGLGVTGLIVADFGEDPNAWPNLQGQANVYLKVETLATAPASWRATCAQDFAVGLEHYGLN